MRPTRIAIALMSVAIVSCSSVQFTEEGSEKTGFLYYPPKPYLLVEKTKDGDKTSVISLPDTSRPSRVKQTGWFGTSEMGFDVAGGMITKFNSKTDSKTPELITALAGVGTAKAALETADAAVLTAKKSVLKSTLVGGAQKYEVNAFVEAANDIPGVVNVLNKAGAVREAYSQVIQILNAQKAILVSKASIDFDSNKPNEFLQAVDDARKDAGKVVEELKAVSGNIKAIMAAQNAGPDVRGSGDIASNGIDKIIKSLSAFANSQGAPIGLYEINVIEGRLVLRKVEIE